MPEGSSGAPHRRVANAEEVHNLIFILTAQCNLRCAYCYQTAKKTVSLPWDVLRDSIDLVFGSGSHNITLLFTGGEPLLEWALLQKAFEYVSANTSYATRARFEISTNGLLLTHEIAQFLDEHRFGVQLSFDGIANAQEYRCAGSFTALNSLLDRLRAKQPGLFSRRLRIVTTQIPDTVCFLAESIRYLLGKGVTEIGISPSLTPSPGWTKEGIQILDVQFRRVYDDSMRHLEKTGEVPLTLFRKWQDDSDVMSGHGSCSAVSGKTVVVDATGQVYGCAMFAESYQDLPPGLLQHQLAPLRMGYLQDGTLQAQRAAYRAAIAKSELFGGMERRYSSYGKCVDCPYVNSCRVCPVSIGYDPGDADPYRVSDFICAFSRIALKYRAMFPGMPKPLDELNALLKRIITEKPGAG